MPKQLSQNISELEKELQKARKEENTGLAVSLLQTLLGKSELPEEKRKEYLW